MISQSVTTSEVAECRHKNMVTPCSTHGYYATLFFHPLWNVTYRPRFFHTGSGALCCGAVRRCAAPHCTATQRSFTSRSVQLLRQTRRVCWSRFLHLLARHDISDRRTTDLTFVATGCVLVMNNERLFTTGTGTLRDFTMHYALYARRYESRLVDVTHQEKLTGTIAKSN